MKIIKYISVIFLLIFCCKNKYSSKEISGEIAADDLYSQYENIEINGLSYVVSIDSEGVFSVENHLGKEIFRDEAFTHKFKFVDFDSDGYQDIILEYVTNVPGIQELLLYSPEKKLFIKVDNYSHYPASKRIKDTRFLFSYSRAGCADSNWESNLFVIKDFKTIQLGKIVGVGCKDAIMERETGIYIYTFSEKGKELKKYIEREEGYWDGKWDFIEKYWKENYKNFN